MFMNIILELPKQPCILLMFTTSDKKKQESSVEVHGVSVKSNVDNIRVDGKDRQIFIEVGTPREHIKWIAALKFSITQSTYVHLSLLIHFRDAKSHIAENYAEAFIHVH